MGFLDEQARALKPFLKEVAKEEYGYLPVLHNWGSGVYGAALQLGRDTL